jgi:hypothetical protein
MKAVKLLLLALVITLTGCSTVKYAPFARLPADLPNYRWMQVEDEVVLIKRETGVPVNVTKTELKQARKMQYAALKVFAKRLWDSRPKMDPIE